MRIFSLLASGFFSIAISGLANAAGFFVGGGVGVMDGIVLETGYKINPFLAVRARGTYLPHADTTRYTQAALSIGSSSNSLTHDIRTGIDSKSLDLGLEFRPAPFIPVVRSLSIIGSIQYLDIDLQARKDIAGQSVKLGGTTYNISNGFADFVISNKQKFAPFIGIGYDILNLPFISLRLTAGGSIRSFEVSSAKYNLSGVPQANIDAEIKKLNDKVNKTVIVPSITLTGRFVF